MAWWTLSGRPREGLRGGRGACLRAGGWCVEGGEAAEADVERGMGARGRSSRYWCSKMGMSAADTLA